MIDYAETTQQFLSPRGQPLTITYRLETNDFNTVSSCLTHDEYGLRGLVIDGLALDIGAYIGPVTLALLADNPDLRVIALEPVPDNVELLKRNIEQNGFTDRATVIAGAAGGPKQKRTLIHYRYSGTESADHHAFIGNSTLMGTGTPCPSEIPHEHIDVPSYTLARLAPQGARFAKIDCEGGEWGFLRSRGLSSVPEWVGEFHPTDGHVRSDLIPLFAGFDLTFSGPEAGPGGFRAVLQ